VTGIFLKILISARLPITKILGIIKLKDKSVIYAAYSFKKMYK
jgi:hypothetical protein